MQSIGQSTKVGYFPRSAFQSSVQNVNGTRDAHIARFCSNKQRMYGSADISTTSDETQTCTAPIFSIHSPIGEANTSQPKPIIKSKDRMYNVDSCASLHISVGKETRPADQKQHGDPNREWHRPFHGRCEGLHPGDRHSPRHDVGGRFALGIVSWSVVRLMCLVFLLVAMRKKPNIDEGKKTITCFSDIFVLLVAFTQQQVTPSTRRRPQPGEPCVR